MHVTRMAAAVLGTVMTGSLLAPAMAQEVNLYTTREPGLIRPLLDAFTSGTGIEVNTVFIKDGLPERVAAEGENSPADVLITVDFGNLIDLVDKGVSQAVRSDVLDAAIPPALRDPDGHWYTLSMRARVIYASVDRVEEDHLTYDDLADSKWRGRVCIRSGQHPYNTALFAAYIARNGVSSAETWLEGIRDNTARKPGGGDRDVARDILGGICDIGPANSYYVGRMRSGAGGPDQKEWGAAIKVILPRFEGGGTHVNVSGAAIAANAPNRDHAVTLLEFLVSDEAQKLLANANYEYPVKEGILANPLIAELGELVADDTPLVEIAAQRRVASELVDKVGFNN
jgi:iron(III) transport system substrate-binding protein